MIINAAQKGKTNSESARFLSKNFSNEDGLSTILDAIQEFKKCLDLKPFYKYSKNTASRSGKTQENQLNHG
jgi:hypothetical protein